MPAGCACYQGRLSTRRLHLQTNTTLTPLFLSPRGVESSCAVSPELVLGSALADLDDVAARRAPPPDSLDARTAPVRGGLHSARPHGCPGPLTPRTPRPPKLLWWQDGEVEGHDCRTGKATSNSPGARPLLFTRSRFFVARRLCSRSGGLRPLPECERPRGLPGETAPVRNESVVPSLLRSSAAAPASGPPPVLGLAPNFPLGTRALLWCPRHRAWLIHPY